MVGPNFSDPETQAAIAAQAAAAQGGDPKQEPSTEPATEPETKPTQEPNTEPAKEPAQQDPATETVDDDLNMTQATEEPAATEPAKLDEPTEQELADKAKKEKADQIVKMNNFIYGELAGGDAEKGKENFDTLRTWCKANMDKDQLGAINHLLKSDNQAIVRQGLQQAVTAWKGAQVKPMMTGDADATNGESVAPKFEPLTKSEFIKEMNSEKYNTDPKYAAEIDARRKKTMDQEAWRPPGFYADTV